MFETAVRVAKKRGSSPFEPPEVFILPFLPRFVVNGREIPFKFDATYDKTGDTVLANNIADIYYSLPMKKIEKVELKHLLGQARSVYTNEIDSPSGGTSISEYMIPAPKREDIYMVYLTLKPGAMEYNETDILNTQVNGYYEARNYYAPKYEELTTKPDLRTTIHWEPLVKTGANGEATISYYNADPKTGVRVVAEGITESGKPIVGTAVYDVK